MYLSVWLILSRHKCAKSDRIAMTPTGQQGAIQPFIEKIKLRSWSVYGPSSVTLCRWSFDSNC